MRVPACAVAATALIALAAQPALARSEPSAAAFWKQVQARCNVTAAKPASELSRRIAQAAIDEFYRFGGHRIDAHGRLFQFGITAGEQGAEDAGNARAGAGPQGWRRVMTYWRALFGNDTPAMLEVRGHQNAATATEETKPGALLRPDADELLRATDGVSDPDAREVLRETALRAAMLDTPWSAAFISYVVRQAGVSANAFQFANAHRAYIYDAFATDGAELTGTSDQHLYRACPLASTRPRVGDIICNHREPSLAEESAAEVRERIRNELSGPADARSVRRTHCEVVAAIDVGARKMYAIGGNVLQSVTARKLNLRGRSLKFSSAQGHCGGPGDWTLPQPLAATARGRNLTEKCSLNDKNWFVLLQMR